MNRLVQELIRPFLEEETKPNIGYRAGRFNPNSPAERLKDKGIGIVNSKVGLLGTGHYFMGSLEDAQKLKKQLGYPVISQINLDSYNLYRPNDPVDFYENLKATTHYLHGLKPKDLDDPQIKENVKDAIRGFAEYLNLDPKKTAAIFKQYLIDIFKRNDGDLLSNRLLSNYDGIDLRGTDFDDFGAGSIIFNGKLKSDTYNELTDLKENRHDATQPGKDAKDLKPKTQAIMAKHQISAKEFNDQLKKGTEVEKEHTSNPKTAMKIALGHIDENSKYYDILAIVGLEEAVTHEMSIEDFNNVGEALRNPKKAKAIYDLLLQMFPKQKEVIDYNYKNDSFAEMKRIIHGIDKYKLVGPVTIQPKEMKLDPEVEAEREKKFQQFIKGEIDKYFRTDKTDPRKVDVSKFPPIMMDEEGFVSDGNHRAFIAKKQNKPLKAYKYVAAKNDHPNVAKILKLVGRSLNPISSLDESYTPEVNELQSLLTEFTSFLIEDGMTISPFPKINLEKSEEEANNPLGKTAYYNPEEQSITLFILNRHPKDILRSYSHELVHHMQNLEGRLKPMTTTNVHEDDELAEMEKEAHELGSLNLRRWEDSLKQ